MMPRLRPDYQRSQQRLAYLRSFLPIVAVILLFSFFLSSLALLSHFRSPAKKQQIGWQSWDVVETSNSGGISDGGEDVETGNGTSGGTDYVPSIPLDNWVSAQRTSDRSGCFRQTPITFASRLAGRRSSELTD
jgi:hypothetical protein